MRVSSKYRGKYAQYIFAPIRDWKHAIIILCFEWHAMRFKPFFGFFRSKCLQSGGKKIPTTHVFGLQGFHIKNTRGHITASTTRDEELLSQPLIALKQVYHAAYPLCCLQNRRGSHESRRSSANNCNMLHILKYSDFLSAVKRELPECQASEDQKRGDIPLCISRGIANIREQYV